ncbi:type II toxin-antitoxin system VapC family toxin [Xanthomonas theicola]|uniref:PIN domain-containing protein n=1 Tax=Xanthomonas theicola TaxID=56464 RepID=A0A2S6ZJF8_9XANT|nr:type II toxin-antitoxin system VapC family toxin [Xanthomonas theicola]PPT92387.1 hypothetical protein XthCFBP4691_03995 [Xanthomonas theicola]QNH25105.1 type II toxin-antitoxin system VapC family toxin [Xanthomonas theicola]
MKYLLDTHLLIWAAAEETPPQKDSKLPPQARQIIEDEINALYFSSMSIWELVIKFAKKSPLFDHDPHQLRQQLNAHGYEEISLDCDDALEIGTLPPLHNDPFDRALIAQAQHQGLILLTCDGTIAQYSGYPILYIPPVP